MNQLGNSRTLCLLLSLMLSLGSGILIYLISSFLSLVIVGIGVTVLAGLVTIMKYHGWLYFGVPVIGLAIGIAIGRMVS